MPHAFWRPDLDKGCCFSLRCSCPYPTLLPTPGLYFFLRAKSWSFFKAWLAKSLFEVALHASLSRPLQASLRLWKD